MENCSTVKGSLRWVEVNFTNTEKLNVGNRDFNLVLKQNRTTIQQISIFYCLIERKTDRFL